MREGVFQNYLFLMTYEGNLILPFVRIYEVQHYLYPLIMVQGTTKLSFDALSNPV